jgi:hypothetical protein
MKAADETGILHLPDETIALICSFGCEPKDLSSLANSCTQLYKTIRDQIFRCSLCRAHLPTAMQPEWRHPDFCRKCSSFVCMSCPIADCNNCQQFCCCLPCAATENSKCETIELQQTHTCDDCKAANYLCSVCINQCGPVRCKGCATLLCFACNSFRTCYCAECEEFYCEGCFRAECANGCGQLGCWCCVEDDTWVCLDCTASGSMRSIG